MELREFFNDNKSAESSLTKSKIENFQKVFDKFKLETIRIRNDGLGVFLVGNMEEKILELRNFVEKSLKDSKTTASVRISANVFGMNFQTQKTISKTKFTFIPKSLSIYTSIEFTTKSTIVRCSINSNDFKKQFVESCVIIKEAIREVTLDKVEDK